MESKEVTNKLNGPVVEIEDDDLRAVGEELVDVVQLVGFVLDDVEYGVDILNVFEIQKMHQIAHLPNSPDYIKGILNLRGDVIPVIDLRVRFGIEATEATEFSRIIVIDTEGKKIGLFVDSVRKVLRIPEANVSPPSELITDLSEEFVHGIGRMQDHLVIILNVTNIIGDAQKIKEVESAEA